MNPEYQKALDDAPVMDTVYIPGLPADPVDMRLYMWLVEHNTCGHAEHFLAEARHSFADHLTGGDGLGPWRD